jgi:very-short-patch-repair endonuclease
MVMGENRRAFALCMAMSHKARTQGGDRLVGAHQSLADLAERQHGVISIRQMETLGYSRDAVSYASRSGRLHRLHRGVYAVGHRSLTWHSHCLAAVLACGTSAVASHSSAAWLWGLLRYRPGRLHVTSPRRRHAKAAIGVHYARLADDDRAACEGIPVTAIPRTLLDLAATLSAPGLNRAMERAEELGLFDLGAIDALLDRAGGHPGVGRLRLVLAIYRPDSAFTRSHLERRFRRLLEGTGLPMPSMNFWVGEYELDAYWQPERFAVELDVYETHGSRAAFEEDRLRQENLKLMGIEMIRVTGPRLDREPARVIERVGALLEQRRRLLRADGKEGE